MYTGISQSFRNLRRRDGGAGHSSRSVRSSRSLPTRSDPSSLTKTPSRSCLKKFGSRDTPKKHVSYSSTVIREFGVIIGDNPSVNEGIPVTLEWDHHNEVAYGVEDYENDHRQPKKETLEEMKLTREQRDAIAKELGYSDRKIKKISHDVKFSTLSRKKKVIQTLHLDVLKENVTKGVEAISEKTKQLRGTKEEEEEEVDDRDMLAY